MMRKLLTLGIAFTLLFCRLAVLDDTADRYPTALAVTVPPSGENDDTAVATLHIERIVR